ncbi:1-phosphatidylinositol-3-phosphate 5-kinase, partial [Coprinopsis sp. MPI-PUGE-AT-0042]
ASSPRSSRRRKHTSSIHDPNTMTSFPNPYAEDDEQGQSSYNLVTSFLSKMKSSISAPLSSGSPGSSTISTVSMPSPTVTSQTATGAQTSAEARRPSLSATQTTSASSISTKAQSDRPHHSLFKGAPQVAPPLVSLTPAQSEVPTFDNGQRPGMPYSPYEWQGSSFGNSIPGFPIADDTRSIKTATTLHRSHSVSKVMRRIRGEGLSKDYWMDDANAKECYDCKSMFTTWRRKHHCRICGQIFCSRCASNVIKGVRFGHDGTIRVCNLCLEKLASAEEDDEDDRRSVVSSVTFPAHQLGAEAFAPGRHPQSPFAPSQLFGRTQDSFNLYAITEGRQLLSDFYNDDDTSSRLMFTEDENGQWRENPAPFRRPMSDEGDELDSLVSPVAADDLTPSLSSSGRIEFPKSSLNVDVSSVQFPLGSPELDSPGFDNRTRNPFNGDPDAATPFIRSRAQSRLDSMIAGETGWRTRRESTAYAQELNYASMSHLRVMLEQMLRLENIPNSGQWMEVLLKLALRIAREMTFTMLPHRQGQDMDVRRYVKIKKIPGGMPKDSEYINGAVITKNVAHKKMSRSIHNPRVMLVTFPLEFHRVEGQYLHFSQIVRQEKEYLTNLTSRIAALRPHVVLVEKSVSRLALDSLAQHNIAVARSVKPSAIKTVARMTQGDVFSSIDKLALEPRLGHCARFRIQTFDHHLIPGRRKSYMRFEGCSRDMGCTIILRGGNIETLRRVKKVTRFLTFIVRNLKLETHLWKDSVISLPALDYHNAVPHNAADAPGRGRALASLNLAISPALPSPSLATPTVESVARQQISGLPPPSASDSLPDETPPVEEETEDEKKKGTSVTDEESSVVDEEEERKQLTKRIDESLEPYTKTFISVSATLRFPPPYPIRRMKELDDELIAAKQAWEDEVVRTEERLQSKHRQEATITLATANAATNVRELEQQQQQASEEDDIKAQIEALAGLSSTPPSEGSLSESFTSPAVSMESEGSSYFPSIPSSTPSLAKSPTDSRPEMEPLKTQADIQYESKYTLTKWKHEEHRRIWEWYLRKNKDDFVVEKYQCISLREFTVPMDNVENSRPCFPPSIRYVTFYGDNDQTLGQFIEKSVSDTLIQFLDPRAICHGKGCDKPLARHAKVFIHNETQMFVAVEQWDGQVKARPGYFPPELIITWSVCRVCGAATPFIPVSEEMQRYSFSKFLEAYFYPADVRVVQGAGCQHNIYQHHTRFFSTRGATVKFKADPITLHEIGFPPFRIRIRPETQLEIKNSEFLQLHERTNQYYERVVHSLGLLKELVQAVKPATTDEEHADTQFLAEIEGVVQAAKAEKHDICRLINTLYRQSLPTDPLVFNQVHAYRQDKMVEMDSKIRTMESRLESAYPDRSSKRVSEFGTMKFWHRRREAFRDLDPASSGHSEAEDNSIRSKPRRSVGDVNSSASEASEAEDEKARIPKVSEQSAPPLSPLGQAPAPSPEEKERNAEVPTMNEESTEDSAAAQDSPATLSAAMETADEVYDKSASENKSDTADSDSTIGAKKASSSANKKLLELPAVEVPVPRLSRLPRRTAPPPSVADLVKKYSDYIPPQGVKELSKTAFAPKTATMSESEQEYPTLLQRRTLRNKNKQSALARKPSMSDFEQGYAANARHPIQPKRPLTLGRVPRTPASTSRVASRQQSPERFRRDGPESPTPGKTFARSTKLRVPSRTHTDRSSSRPTSVGPSAGRTTLRRPPQSPIPGKVVSANIRHFERLGRDAAKSKYTVLRGKRARPVVNTRAKVEILTSIKDIIADDESEGSNSESSEADDEGDDLEDVDRPPPSKKKGKPPIPQITKTSASAEPTPPATEPTLDSPKPAEPKVDSAAETSSINTEPVSATPAPSEPPSVPPSPFLAPGRPRRGEMPHLSDTEGGPGEKSSFIRWTINLLSLDQSTEDLYGDPESEHIFRDSAMVVRFNEPTSFIALALNSPQYHEFLTKSRAEKRTARVEAKVMEASEAFMPDDRSVSDSTSTWGVVNVDSVDSADPTEDLRVASSKHPWQITFDSDDYTISCAVLYPEQFDALRRTYDCEKSFVESLARCVDWNASGGKSGSAFRKTQDDRFIAKELSRAELQAMEKFAPSYFDYMSSAVSANRPTLLAKVFGCYKLTIKQKERDANKERGPARKNRTVSQKTYSLLVMENLFYDRKFTRIYDLKGSTRNRHVKSTGRQSEVLLDENLVEESHKNPFHLREHSKRILRGALFNDSKFLADINVMDYSLVCGVDSENNELVVGIVDYIRTYTWDKKLESWVKESTFLGGAGKGEPTIVTPKQYRQRFLAAMERYFPLVPDRWMKLHDQPEDESSTALSELWPDW